MPKKLTKPQINALGKLNDEWARTPRYGWRDIRWCGIGTNTARSLCDRGLLEMKSKSDGHSGFDVYRITRKGQKALDKAVMA